MIIAYGGMNLSGSVRPTSAIEVLNAIVSKIRTSVPMFSDETTCFITAYPEPSIEFSDNVFCTVSFNGGQFDQSIMDGAGNVGVVQLATITLGVFTRIETDQIERSVLMLTDVNRGALTLLQQVLTAMAGKNLDGGGDTQLLLEAIYPHRNNVPRNKSYDEFYGMEIDFDVKFLWDLGGVSSMV